MDWKTLQRYDFKEKINRKSEIQDKYEYEKRIIKKKGLDYDKYILKKYLNNKIYNLQPNKFPYDLQKNIKHYVLWLNPALKSKFIHNQKFIRSILKEYIPDKQFIYYMNSYQNKSIKPIPHYQVFIKTD